MALAPPRGAGHRRRRLLVAPHPAASRARLLAEEDVTRKCDDIRTEALKANKRYERSRNALSAAQSAAVRRAEETWAATVERIHWPFDV